jgi:hypothetical protein
MVLLKDPITTPTDEGQTLLRLNRLIEKFVERYLRGRTHHGVSAEDIASDMVLGCWRRPGARRFIRDQADLILSGHLPRSLQKEARRKALDLRRKATTGLLDEPVGQESRGFEKVNNLFEDFLSSLHPGLARVAKALSEGTRKMTIASQLEMRERTFRNRCREIREAALAAGLHPRRKNIAGE